MGDPKAQAHRCRQPVAAATHNGLLSLARCASGTEAGGSIVNPTRLRRVVIAGLDVTDPRAHYVEREGETRAYCKMWERNVGRP